MADLLQCHITPTQKSTIEYHLYRPSSDDTGLIYSIILGATEESHGDPARTRANTVSVAPGNEASELEASTPYVS